MHVIRQKMTFLDLAFLLLGQFPEYISQMPAASTAGYVKLFVPPRQSRGNSYWGLGMACGDYVLDDEALVKEILSRLSRDQKFSVTTVEMESTAVRRGIEQNGQLPEYLVVKAISDFAYGKTDSAQSYARATAAYFLRGLLLKLAGSKRFAVQKRERAIIGTARVILGPSKNVEAMLQDFPLEHAAQWQHRAIDGAIEILRCTRSDRPYGGLSSDQIICDIDNTQEWPDQFGGLSDQQVDSLSIGLVGHDGLAVSGG